MKYRNKLTNGYHSKREANRARDLKSYQAGGIIKNLREQVPFQVIPKQYRDGKMIERESTYIADFVYEYEGAVIVEDAKGVKTRDYVLKRKLMLLIHGIRIQEV